MPGTYTVHFCMNSQTDGGNLLNEAAYSLMNKLDKSCCIEYTTTDQVLSYGTLQPSCCFVFSEFYGEAFEHAESLGFRCFGAPAVLVSLMRRRLLPYSDCPLFSFAFASLRICLSGFDEDDFFSTAFKLQLMGAEVTEPDQLLESADHRKLYLVVKGCCNQTQINALKAQIPVMKPQWIDEVLECCQSKLCHATDSPFIDMKLPRPPLFGLSVTVSNVPREERPSIQQMCLSLGADFTLDLVQATATHLITDVCDGAKFKAAKKWKIFIVTLAWLKACVAQNCRVPEKDFNPECPVAVTSTPVQSQAAVLNLDDVSAIRPTGLAVLTRLSRQSNSAKQSLIEESRHPTSNNVFQLQLRSLDVDTFLSQHHSGGSRSQTAPFLRGCVVSLDPSFDADERAKLEKFIRIGEGKLFSVMDWSMDTSAGQITHFVVKQTDDQTESSIDMQRKRITLGPMPAAKFYVSWRWLASSAIMKVRASENEFKVNTDISETKTPSSTSVERTNFSRSVTEDRQNLMSQYLAAGAQMPSTATDGTAENLCNSTEKSNMSSAAESELVNGCSASNFAGNHGDTANEAEESHSQVVRSLNKQLEAMISRRSETMKKRKAAKAKEKNDDDELMQLGWKKRHFDSKMGAMETKSSVPRVGWLDEKAAAAEKRLAEQEAQAPDSEPFGDSFFTQPTAAVSPRPASSDSLRRINSETSALISTKKTVTANSLLSKLPEISPVTSSSTAETTAETTVDVGVSVQRGKKPHRRRPMTENRPPPPLFNHDECSSKATTEESVAEPAPTKENVFMFTSIAPSDKDFLVSVVERLGGRVINQTNFSNSCTHLVLGSLARSEKAMSAIARGIWLLHPNYLHKCNAANQFVDEADFEWGKQSMGAQQNKGLVKAARRWRLKIAHNGGLTAFSGWKVALFVNKRREKQFITILQAGGAEVLMASAPCSLNELISSGVQLAIFETNISDSVDLTVFAEANVPCVLTDYISAHLLEQNAKLDDYLIEKYETMVKSRSGASGSGVGSSHVTDTSAFWRHSRRSNTSSADSRPADSPVAQRVRRSTRANPLC